MINNQNNRSSDNTPHISVHAQYVKDFSFENPNAPKSLSNLTQPPKIDLALDLHVNRLSEENFFEVIINISAKASSDDLVLFIVELKYAGVFNLINIPEDEHQVILAINCPAMIFPYARKKVADATQDGGFQPLMIDPIDFGTLYFKKMSENS